MSLSELKKRLVPVVGNQAQNVLDEQSTQKKMCCQNKNFVDFEFNCTFWIRFFGPKWIVMFFELCDLKALEEKNKLLMHLKYIYIYIS